MNASTCTHSRQGPELRAGLMRWIGYYNTRRPSFDPGRAYAGRGVWGGHDGEIGGLTTTRTKLNSGRQTVQPGGTTSHCRGCGHCRRLILNQAPLSVAWISYSPALGTPNDGIRGLHRLGNPIQVRRTATHFAEAASRTICLHTNVKTHLHDFMLVCLVSWRITVHRTWTCRDPEEANRSPHPTDLGF